MMKKISLQDANPSMSDDTIGKQLVHVVKHGETLSKIAHHYRVTMERLMTLNHLSNPNMIVTGQTLHLPDRTKLRMAHYIESTGVNDGMIFVKFSGRGAR